MQRLIRKELFKKGGVKMIKTKSDPIWMEATKATGLAEKLGSAGQSAKIIAKQANISFRWAMHLIQVHKRFGKIRLNYPNLNFQHFICVVSIKSNKKVKKWLDKANNEN